MYGSVVIEFITISLLMFFVMDKWLVLGCSPPNYRITRSFRARAHEAEVVVFATVLDSPGEAKHRINAYYSAQLSVHCILKGPQLPRIITVHGFGNDGGGCTRTDAVSHKSYIFLLKNINGLYRLHNVGMAPAAKRAREKILLRLLPDFWSTSHRPYKRRPARNRTMHCPTLKKMKRILRRSMRKYIRSKPDLSKKRRQLKEWLKKLRTDRKTVKKVFDLDYKNVSISTPLITNSVELMYKPTMKYNTGELRRVNNEKKSLAKRSIAEIIGNNIDVARNDASCTRLFSTALWSLTFAWLVICILGS